jgi:DNA polymerase-3 subunit epsilon
MRQVVLDTETTGLEVDQGHRIIEIGCLELVNRRRTNRTFHRYIRPDREIDLGATEVHGISGEMLEDQPRFPEIVDEFVEFISGAELVIHNADFDVGFLNQELRLSGRQFRAVQEICPVVDTLALARRLHPGQRNSLDALCKRYSVDNSGRALHGALLDAELLADVYLAMTGGQANLLLGELPGATVRASAVARHLDRGDLPLLVVRARADEISEHERHLELIDRESGGRTVWRSLPVK